MENKLNIDNLRTFVNALNNLPDDIKNNKVDMNSTQKPICDTAGCHAGLISIVADYVPELKSLYFKDYNYDYDYSEWTHALARFLGFNIAMNLKGWGYNNPEIWGNDYGLYMFGKGTAFGQDSNIFKHSVIIKHWNEVLLRVEQEKHK